MKALILECPGCGEYIRPGFADKETITDDAIIQTFHIVCHECGTIFDATDTFTLTDRKYRVLKDNR